MAKTKSIYSCTECGAQASKWAGQCGDCGAWNSMVEVAAPVRSNEKRSGRFEGYAGESAIQSLTEISALTEHRFSTGIDELDRVLGGGLVQGSVVMIGGDPGIGKSTLLLQALISIGNNLSILYVTGEESLQQVSMRAHRLNLSSDKLRLLAETNIERILEHSQLEKPQVIVIDSVQTIYTDILQSAPGSVAQLRESTASLVRFAKQTGTSLLLVGHVTKEGTLAGPRVLEHMVDTVLYFEGDTNSQYRVLRATKNRFGTVNELGVFVFSFEFGFFNLLLIFLIILFILLIISFLRKLTAPLRQQ